MGYVSKTEQNILNRAVDTATGLLKVLLGGDTSLVDTTQHRINIKDTWTYTASATGTISGSNTGYAEVMGYMVTTLFDNTLTIKDGASTTVYVSATNSAVGTIITFPAPVKFTTDVRLTFAGAGAVTLIWRT